MVISDDSAPENTETREAVRKYAEEYPQPVYWLNEHHKKVFIESVAPELRESAAFALGMETAESCFRGIPFGANRNFLLLLTAGSSLAMFDDDILPEFRARPDLLPGTALYSGPDPSLIKPFADSAELEAFGEVSRADFPGFCSSYLGSTVAEAVSREELLDITRADRRIIELLSEPESRIAAGCVCYWGDSGMPGSAFLLGLRDYIEADYADSEKYEAMISSRMIYRSPERTAIGGRTMMGGCTCFDNSRLLPPFSPKGAYEDGLWAACLDALHPLSRIIYPGWAVLHRPVPPRTGSRERAVQWRLNLNESLQLLIGHFLSAVPIPSDPQSRYRMLGQCLTDFSVLSPEEIRSTMCSLTVKAISGRMNHLTAVLNAYNAEPEWWADDMYQAIEHSRDYLTDSNLWIPRDGDGEEDRVIRYFRDFGELLKSWPDLVSQAGMISPELLKSAEL